MPFRNNTIKAGLKISTGDQNNSIGCTLFYSTCTSVYLQCI